MSNVIPTHNAAKAILSLTILDNMEYTTSDTALSGVCYVANAMPQAICFLDRRPQATDKCALGCGHRLLPRCQGAVWGYWGGGGVLF